ncbi:hypothetical protein N7468_004396 [Penicillium chermesinum]|uniref:Uncharacterized protein n=1 Tax=Penicillium chermesinum TaxID=63820 RepID=A0A9W9P8I3_9EURO|nr:uncharacterized protein N7468_004396 [Penicillium chermesinum]KAJ5239777.1 hypothetical protein N7468_004396 [Penicillium chermesinum]KAJ6166656.1 hypothetical protein N7470_002103 [Penicillium chermesinum]
MATTPPPPSPSALRMPAAPLHGSGYDTFEPYPTRSSARLASQRASRKETTPPNPGSPSTRIGSPKKGRRTGETALSTPSGSSSTNQRRGKAMASLMSSECSNSQFGFSSSSRASTSHPLPTPAKTPSKKSTPSNFSSTSRTLFPSASKMGRRRTPFALECFADDPAFSNNIEIFTDSRDRIPEASTDQSNPFSAAPAEMPKTPARRKPSPRREGRVTRAAQREMDLESNESMNFMFRGKRVIRKMVEDEETDSDDPNGLSLFLSRPDLLPDSEVLNDLKPLRAEDVKPRMLWERKDKPRKQSTSYEESLEDAATDDEDIFNLDPKSPAPTSLDLQNAPGARTLSDGRFGTPEETPSGAKQAATATDTQPKRPFANWMRKKNPDDISPATTPVKRGPSDDMANPVDVPSSKRTRAGGRR